MAVIFCQRQGNRTYQVRRAGSAKRLYTNGVFHSQWNPNRPLAGAVWDLLSLPVLYLDSAYSRPVRVLLLGVGGGAGLKQLGFLVPEFTAVGVELDPMHLTLAKDHFGVDQSIAELHCADAVQWLQDYKGPRFDYVIDDLFSHNSGEAERAVPMNKRWAKLLWKVTARDGAVVANFTGVRELRESALMALPHRCAYQWSQTGYENAIGVFLAGDGNARRWRAALDGHPALNAAQRRTALAAVRRKIS